MAVAAAEVLRALEGAAALGAEMAVGLAMAQQMLAGVGGGGQASGSSEVITPADAARILNVSEADVIASLDAGDLKGKKIGSHWRLTRAQLAEFMR